MVDSCCSNVSAVFKEMLLTRAQKLRNRKIFMLAPYHSYSETGLKASLWEYSCYFAQYDYWSPHFL